MKRVHFPIEPGDNLTRVNAVTSSYKSLELFVKLDSAADMVIANSPELLHDYRPCTEKNPFYVYPFHEDDVGIPADGTGTMRFRFGHHEYDFPAAVYRHAQVLIPWQVLINRMMADGLRVIVDQSTKRRTLVLINTRTGDTNAFTLQVDATGLYMSSSHIVRPQRLAASVASATLPIRFKGGPDTMTSKWPMSIMSAELSPTTTEESVEGEECRCDVDGSTGRYYKGTMADWFEALDHCVPYRTIQSLAKRIPNMIITDTGPARTRKAPPGSRQQSITPSSKCAHNLRATSRRPSNTGKRPDLGVISVPPLRPRWEGDLLNITPTGINGERYVLLCVDRQGTGNADHGRITYRILKQRDAQTLSEAFRECVTEYGAIPLSFATDPGREFKGELTAVLKELDIADTSSDTADHNAQALVETTNGIIGDRLRVILMHTGAPTTFWPYAITRAIAITNLLRCGNTFQTPHYLDNGVDLALVTVPFGCCVVAHIPREKRQRDGIAKAEARGKVCFVLGVNRSSHTRSWWVLDCENKLWTTPRVIKLENRMNFRTLDLIVSTMAQVEITIQPGNIVGWQRPADLQPALAMEQFAMSKPTAQPSTTSQTLHANSSPEVVVKAPPVVENSLTEDNLLTPPVVVEEDEEGILGCNTEIGLLSPSIERPANSVLTSETTTTSLSAPPPSSGMTTRSKTRGLLGKPYAQSDERHPRVLHKIQAASARPADRAKLNADGNLTAIPRTLREAAKTSQASDWHDASLQEIDNIITKCATVAEWSTLTGDDRNRLISAGMILDYKSSTGKCKARLVAHGNQSKAFYTKAETSSSPVSMPAIKSMMSSCLTRGFDFDSIDYSSAYLNSPLPQPQYVRIARDVADLVEELTSTPVPRNASGQGLLRLDYALYGLANAGKLWEDTLIEALAGIKFEQSKSDRGVFYAVDEDSHVACILLVFVDDIFIISKPSQLAYYRKKLLSLFVGTIATTDDYVGLKFSRSSDGKSLLINQARYIEKIVERFDLANCAPVHLPALPSQRLSDFLEDEPLESAEPYQQLVGCLLWSSVTVRPDIGFAVKETAKYTHAPRRGHFRAARKVLKYLATSKKRGLVFRSDRVDRIPGCKGIVVYVDAGFADNQPNMRSTSGILIFLDGNLVHHVSCTQRSVSLSTAEAELHALKEGIKNAVWLHGLMTEVQHDLPDRIKVFTDNMAAIALVTTEVSNSRTRHIRVWIAYIREQVDSCADVRHVPTDFNVADLLTKNLALPKFTHFAKQALGESDLEFCPITDSIVD
jgi:hypothetical protein